MSTTNTITSRRRLLTGGVVGALYGTGLVSGRPGNAARSVGSDEIRIGLIGCGGRGTGAVRDAMTAAPGVKLVAVGDLFADRVASCRKTLEVGELAANVAIGERAFWGFDAFEKVLACDVNYVVLATPCGFRPQHLARAIAAGKNVFAEKPVAVDAPGFRMNLKTADEARRKGLAIAVGLQRRHATERIESMKRVHDGAIGKIVAGRCSWLRGFLWSKPRQPAWTDLEWQLRNWLYFTYLSGDCIVETLTHNIDVMNWGLRGHPVAAIGFGGRQQRTDPYWGHIYDHFAVDYEYPEDVHIFAACREMENTYENVSEHLVGTRGQLHGSTITGASPWKPEGPSSLAYVLEHRDLITSIRKGEPLNELAVASESTMTSIMGRMAAYSGKRVTWQEAVSSQESLMPEELHWGPMATPPVAIPGSGKAI